MLTCLVCLHAYVEGRNLRDKPRINLNYVYTTLGIEKDGSSDDDFILEAEDESENEEQIWVGAGSASASSARRAQL
ncbi:unnamed protein product [Phytophthora fragariaefolia]|uniref:Unnamed protein product n=1 Tax=Phytophthora fragariaefolia TaxID=1490495 RepID=A0A9W6YCM8_9STRA|nr:unnamed protein product [Phytophthora fragariaefolia]